MTHEKPTIVSGKSILCAPDYIQKAWVEMHEVLEFRTIKDILNWRLRTVEFNYMIYQRQVRENFKDLA